MSGSSGSYTFNPLGRSVMTILGSLNTMELTQNLTPLYDLNSTINKKYNVAVTAPTTHPTFKYFGIGIGGTQNVSGGNLSEPNEVSSEDMDLYTPLPFVVVPFAQDLTAQERVNYRMRVIQTINGAQYACYYLKCLSFTSPSAEFFITNPTTGVQTPYTLDYSNLTPTPPAIPVNGVVSPTQQEVSITSTATLNLSGTEVNQAVSALFNGDLRYARISEIGIYSGTDTTVNATDANGNAITYTESLMTQLAIHCTNNGIDMSAPTATFNTNFVFTNGSIVLV